MRPPLDDQQALPSFWRSAAGIALLVVLVVGGFYLVTEYTAHVFGALPYVLVLACPLMHLFMHRGHGHGGHSRNPPSNDDEQHRH
ncbi:MAG: DUF2933 domain-containing protein [Burkholderiaceae bacterium]|nr:DUF2933 domain-containing protein [Burkholderiaceae bacterium]